MPESTVVQWTITQGIGAVLALAIFLMYRKDVKNGLSEVKDLVKRVIGVIESNTAAMTRMTDQVQHCPYRGKRKDD